MMEVEIALRKIKTERRKATEQKCAPRSRRKVMYFSGRVHCMSDDLFLRPNGEDGNFPPHYLDCFCSLQVIVSLSLGLSDSVLRNFNSD